MSNGRAETATPPWTVVSGAPVCGEAGEVSQTATSMNERMADRNLRMCSSEAGPRNYSRRSALPAGSACELVNGSDLLQQSDAISLIKLAQFRYNQIRFGTSISSSLRP